MTRIELLAHILAGSAAATTKNGALRGDRQAAANVVAQANMIADLVFAEDRPLTHPLDASGRILDPATMEPTAFEQIRDALGMANAPLDEVIAVCERVRRARAEAEDQGRRVWWDR